MQNLLQLSQTSQKGLTGAEVAAILKNAATKQVKNVHGDTFQYEETEANTTKYKNALNGEYYREITEPGEVKINFTIGEYDYETKADLQGGKATEKSWERESIRLSTNVSSARQKTVYMLYFQKRLSMDVVLIQIKLLDWQ